MKKIVEQLGTAMKKNEEIKKINEQMKSELTTSAGVMGQYATQISNFIIVNVENQYQKKLTEFEKIFNSSNEKIL